MEQNKKGYGDAFETFIFFTFEIEIFISFISVSFAFGYYVSIKQIVK